MVIKDGRFGPYVTDGETNASLRKGDDVLSITDERASELLADRRARGPVEDGRAEDHARRRRPRRPSQEELVRARQWPLFGAAAHPLPSTRLASKLARHSQFDRPGQLGLLRAAAQFDDLADLPAQRFGIHGVADRLRRRQHVTRLPAWPTRSVGRASLTGSPITVYSKRACAPIWPAIARPAETPMPNSASPMHRQQFVVQLPRGGQRRTGGVGVLDRRAEDGQRGVALELVDEPAVAANGVHDHPEELVEQADDFAGRPRGRQLVEPTRSTNSTATSRSWPPSSVPRSSARRATSSPT